jgi:hypothetical protein
MWKNRNYCSLLAAMSKLYIYYERNHTIDVQSLIFGNSIKNENENRLVFETVSKYIARTKRFD